MEKTPYTEELFKKLEDERLLIKVTTIAYQKNKKFGDALSNYGSFFKETKESGKKALFDLIENNEKLTKNDENKEFLEELIELAYSEMEKDDMEKDDDYKKILESCFSEPKKETLTCTFSKYFSEMEKDDMKKDDDYKEIPKSYFNEECYNNGKECYNNVLEHLQNKLNEKECYNNEKECYNNEKECYNNEKECYNNEKDNKWEKLTKKNKEWPSTFPFDNVTR